MQRDTRHRQRLDGGVEAGSPQGESLRADEHPVPGGKAGRRAEGRGERAGVVRPEDRKSTRLNSSHANISYAVFCLKKKNKTDVILIFVQHDYPSHAYLNKFS